MIHFPSWILHPSLILFLALASSLIKSCQSTNGEQTISTATTTTTALNQVKLLRDPRNNSFRSSGNPHENHRTHSRDFKKEVVVEELLKEDSYFWARELRSMSYPNPVEAMATKTSWPECVNEPLTCLECQAHILAENHPELTNVYILPYDAIVTLDYRTDRVRIFCNETNVTMIPIVG
jgi:hypothetical protein